MNATATLRTAVQVLRKDLRMGPRSPVLRWLLILPLAIVLLVRVALGALFDPLPRLALADVGESQLAAAIVQRDDVALTRCPDAATVHALVASHDADAGLVLPAGFDDQLRGGARPLLDLRLSGESLPSTHAQLVVLLLDEVRALEDRPAPVEVVVHAPAASRGLPVPALIVFSLVLFVLLVAGLFTPAFLLVEEREQGTLSALLVTPATLPAVLLAKAVLGVLLAVALSYVTLALGGALSVPPLALFAALVLGAATCAAIGLLYGTLVSDTRTLYTLVKSLNVLLLGPLVFYFFPEWPQWIAKIFPTYWFIDPLARIALQGATFADVAGELAVAAAVVAALAVPIVWLGRRLEGRLAAE